MLPSDPSGLTSLEAAILDKNSEYLGISTLQLMENAGRSVADEVVARFGRGSSIVIYAGTGRNGGDGMVAARHLAGQGFKVTCKLVGAETSIVDSAALKNWLALKAMSSSINVENHRDSYGMSESKSDVLVDALLGTGVTGRLRQPIRGAVEVVNKSGGFKIAVDVPTGINSDTGEVLGDAVRANLTVTLHRMKKGLLKAKFCGEIKVAYIGIPQDAERIAGPGDVEAAVRYRSPDVHKGEFGRLLVIGGSEMFSGAPALVALAAYRAGTDLVYLAAPEETAYAISSMSPNLITIKLPGKSLASSHIRLLSEQMQNASAIVVGPGLGLAAKTVAAVRRIVSHVRQIEKPLLLDADALNALGVVKKKIFDNLTVVTPHAGEFQAIFGKPPSRDLEVRSREVKELSERSGAVVVLKGHTDIVSDGYQLKCNATGNPGMTVGGTGDVLSGIIGGLLSQGVDGFRAAVAGTFVNGAAGDLAQEEFGYHLTPTDLLEHIPQVMNNPMCHKAILEKRLNQSRV